MPDTLNERTMLPLIAPIIPETTREGLLELLAITVALPKAKILGGTLMIEIEELGGHEKPAPRSVIVQVDTSLAFKVRNSMTSSCTPETDAIGAERDTRFTAAQVVVNLY